MEVREGLHLTAVDSGHVLQRGRTGPAEPSSVHSPPPLDVAGRIHDTWLSPIFPRMRLAAGRVGEGYRVDEAAERTVCRTRLEREVDALDLPARRDRDDPDVTCCHWPAPNFAPWVVGSDVPPFPAGAARVCR